MGHPINVLASFAAAVATLSIASILNSEIHKLNSEILHNCTIDVTICGENFSSCESD